MSHKWRIWSSRLTAGIKQRANCSFDLNLGFAKILAGIIITTIVIASSLSFPITSLSKYALADDAQPTLLTLAKGPYLQNVTRTTITICWESEELTRDSVEYGLTTDYGNVISDVNPSSQHEITLTNLVPSTTYHYRVESGGIFTEDSIFTTAFDYTEPFTFVVYGDNRPHNGVSHSPPTAHTDVLHLIQEIGPSFYISTGDLVKEAGERQADWDLFFDESKELMRNTPLFPVLGNHEGHAKQYYDYFSLPGNERWYSFTYGNSYFIILDSNIAWWEFTPDDEQLKWLESELKVASSKSLWKFVFFHYPPYDTEDPEKVELTFRKYFCPLFKTYGVNMVFNGHKHFYEHNLVNDIHYITTGGGGAPLYDPDEPKSWTVYQEKNYHVTKIHIDGSFLRFEAVRSPQAIVMESFWISLPHMPSMVLSSTPTGEDVLLSTSIVVAFSKPMNRTSSQNAFSISPSVRGTFSWDGNTMAFTPTVGLSSGRTYIVTISEEAIDLEGNPLSAPYSWQLTTLTTPSSLRKAIIITGIVVLVVVGNWIFWEIRKRKKMVETR